MGLLNRYGRTVMLTAAALAVGTGLLFGGGPEKSGAASAPEAPAEKPGLQEPASKTPIPNAAKTFTDERDGQKYRVAAVGGRTWMAENLNYATVDSVGSWCYKNENSNCDKYGKLYDWETAMEVCPWGWHLPTNSEWDELVEWVAFVSGGEAGDKLKAKSGWRNHDGRDVDGTDDYGFSALPGGFRSAPENNFGNALRHGYWWTATREGHNNAGTRNIDTYGGLGYRVNAEFWRKDAGLSVRCVMDENRSGAYSLSLKSGPGGTAARFPAKTSYNAGKIVTISAYPKRGYAFVNWTGGKTANDTALTTTVVMNSNMAVTANFRRSATLPEGESAFTDTRDGNIYITVKIRNQTWMAENLNYQPPTGNSWCYGNSLDSCAKYGRLYDWNTAMAGKAGSDENPSGVRGVCPEGWHLPSGTEWYALLKFVENWHSYSVVGKKLKSKSGWESERGGNGNGDDNYGFSALPGGYYGDVFISAGRSGAWWTAAEHNGESYNVSLHSGDDYTTGTRLTDKTIGLSVRCVMDKKGLATPPTTSYTLTLKAGFGGTASAKRRKASYNAGEKVTITAVPNKGYAFDKWIGGQLANAAAATVVVSMNADMAITANFRRIDYAPLTDTRDGKEYKTAVIGGKTWMAQNLNYQTEGSWCYKNNNSNCNKYGRLYNWNAAVKACPVGWHLPSRKEWDDLVNYAGGWNAAAKKLKSIEGWDNDDNGTDDYGFSALPGGEYYEYNGKEHFYDGGKDGHWWTATVPKDCGDCAYSRYMQSDRYIKSDEDYVGMNEYGKNYGYSVRCVMDEGGIVTALAKAKAPKQYRLRLKAKTGGTASAAPRKRAYPAGKTVTLIAAPKKGYLFAHWTGGLTEDSASAVTTVAMNSDIAVFAVFNKDATPRGVYGALADARDGKTYKTVNIGGQTWMAENLNYEADNSVCYKNTTDRCQKYGRLYDMDAAKTACPAGWHLPSNQEWEDLIKYAGGKDSAGKKLKSTSGWVQNGNGTDVYGFSTLPGGKCYSKNSFDNVGFYGYWWTSTEGVNAYGNRYAKTWEIRYYDDKAEAYEKSDDRLSVRCVLGEDPAAASVAYTLTLNAGIGGTVSRNPNKASYKQWEKVSISAVPDSGYSFVKWTGGQVANAARAATVAAVNSNMIIAAHFRATADGKRAGGGADFKDVITGMEMAFVSGGTFTMGCTDEQTQCDDEAKPAHSVTVGDFYIGKYEVTQKQWHRVMGSLPHNLSYSSTIKGDNLPVYNVDFNDAQEFIRALSRKTGNAYRLPTEAEWEYAARGGAKSNGYKYSGSDNIGDVAWYNVNSGVMVLDEDSLEEYTRKNGSAAYLKRITSNGNRARAVGAKRPNELGIYDMSGNIWEWCGDWFAPYDSTAQTNPVGPERGSERVTRGGCWCADSWGSRVSTRLPYSPGNDRGAIGFRLALPATVGGKFYQRE